VKAVRRIEVTVDGIPSPRWRARLARFCGSALQEAGHGQWDVAVLLCGDPRMADLNKRYRGKDGPTDVLSFPREDGGDPPVGTHRDAADRVVTGDLAISMDTLRRNAASFGCTDDEELKRLAVHGLLHLAGMDHGSGRGGPMLRLQEELLGRLATESIIGEQTS
jgi:probable rRNA maturation factor